MDTITQTSQILINGEEPKEIGKKVKLDKQPEFKGVNINQLIAKIIAK